MARTKVHEPLGDLIYEDILTLAPDIRRSDDPRELGREVGMRALEEVLAEAEGEIHENVAQAIERGHAVVPSPLHVTASV